MSSRKVALALGAMAALLVGATSGDDVVPWKPENEVTDVRSAP